jgi:hypothetical protein
VFGSREMKKLLACDVDLILEYCDKGQRTFHKEVKIKLFLCLIFVIKHYTMKACGGV